MFEKRALDVLVATDPMLKGSGKGNFIEVLIRKILKKILKLSSPSSFSHKEIIFFSWRSANDATHSP